MELRVGRKYRLGNKIGSGSFGEIYAGSFFIPFALFCFVKLLMLFSLFLLDTYC